MKKNKKRNAIARWRDARPAKGQNCISEANTANNSEFINNKSNPSKTENYMKNLNPMSNNPISSAVAHAISDFYDDFCDYVAKVLGGNPDNADLSWNCVGACIHYFDKNYTIQFRLWERSESYLGIPNMTLIVIDITFKHDSDESAIKAFSLWMAQTARIYGFRHIAIEDEKPTPNDPDQIPGCSIACMALY